MGRMSHSARMTDLIFWADESEMRNVVSSNLRVRRSISTSYSRASLLSSDGNVMAS